MLVGGRLTNHDWWLETEQFRPMFKGDISVSFRDGHPPNSSGVYMSIIRIPYERWDDHPQYRDFLKNIKFTDCLRQNSSVKEFYLYWPTLILFLLEFLCVKICRYLYIQSQQCTQNMQKHILECVHICWAIGKQICDPAHTLRENPVFLENIRSFFRFCASQLCVGSRKRWPRTGGTYSNRVTRVPQFASASLDDRDRKKTHEASAESIDKPWRFLFLMLNLSSRETLVVGYTFCDSPDRGLPVRCDHRCIPIPAIYGIFYLHLLFTMIINQM